MKIYTMILIVILMIAAVLPMNVGLGLLFTPQDAAMKMNISAINEDVTRAMLVLSSYILSWVVLYLLCFIWILKKKRDGIWLAMFLGAITFARGILLLFIFRSNGLEKPIVAYIMLSIGIAITISGIFALRETKDLKS